MFNSLVNQSLLNGAKQTVPTNPAAQQQVRNFSRRRIAYQFKGPRQGRREKNQHRTDLRFQMQNFLGKKNFRGEHVDNRYFFPPTNHRTNYITPGPERGNPLVDFKTGKKKDYKGNFKDEDPIPLRSFNQTLQPFPHNNNCKTNLALSKKDRDYIYKALVVNKVQVQQLAIQMGIKIPRLEAVVKLKQIEENWEKRNLVTKDIKKMADTMYQMFPLFSSQRDAQNLTEIPVPEKTLSSRFLTVAENEPFGPIEAAKIYGLSPASELLEKAAEIAQRSEHELLQTPEQKAAAVIKARKDAGVIRVQASKKNRPIFQFTPAKVGHVGFRYGTVLRDNKRDRKVHYDESGKMIYALPESG